MPAGASDARPAERPGLAAFSGARCFLALPRLALTDEGGSGKTKVLSLLHGVAFNASLCVNATPAVLFRLIEETRPTLLVDEAEALGSDNRRELPGIINAGYKRGRPCLPSKGIAAGGWNSSTCSRLSGTSRVTRHSAPENAGVGSRHPAVASRRCSATW